MDEIELIKEKLNIVDLITEYIPLKKSGINYKANCPFHQEKTPSFMVSAERGTWRCFGCSKGGDHFTFLMEKEGLDFKDALEILAKKAGVTLKKTGKKNDAKDRLFEANEKAKQFYHHILTKHPLGKKALDYLHKRGLTDQTIEDFGLGYAPQNWSSLTDFMKKRGFSVAELIESGLCVPSNSGCYDRFRGRIIFPLLDVRDRILGFSGRIIDIGEPKYINTPQTPVFDKRRLLFGLQLAKGAIRQKDEAILVEGEMDMLMSYQSGIKNIVASKGTALTMEQIESLKKYTENLALCFDTDLAGDAASRRGIEMADTAGMNLKVVSLEGAKDPAETCLKDPKIWEEAVKGSIPIYDYYLQSAQKRFDTKTATGKRALFNELLPIWKKIADPLTKDHYIMKLSAVLMVKDDLIRKELDRVPTMIAHPLSQEGKKEETPKSKKVNYDRRQILEEYLLALLLHIPVEMTYVPNFPETLITREDLKQIYVMLVIFLDSISFKGKSFKINEFVKTLPSELAETVDRIYLIYLDEKLADQKNWQKEVDMVVAELKKMLIKNSLEVLSLQIKSAQELNMGDKLTVLNKKFRDLSVKLRNL